MEVHKANKAIAVDLVGIWKTARIKEAVWVHLEMQTPITKTLVTVKMKVYVLHMHKDDLIGGLNDILNDLMPMIIELLFTTKQNRDKYKGLEIIPNIVRDVYAMVSAMNEEELEDQGAEGTELDQEEPPALILLGNTHGVSRRHQQDMVSDEMIRAIAAQQTHDRDIPLISGKLYPPIETPGEAGEDRVYAGGTLFGERSMATKEHASTEAHSARVQKYKEGLEQAIKQAGQDREAFRAMPLAEGTNVSPSRSGKVSQWNLYM